MARLWTYVDGEPFFINGDTKHPRRNPALAILGSGNPKKGKKSVAKAKKRSYRKSVSRNKPRRRKSYRRNSWPVGGAVVSALGGNPRRRKGGKRRMRSNPVHRRKHHYRRNPAFLGLHIPPLQTVAYVGAGFVATPMLESFITPMLPVTFTSGMVGKYAIKVGSVAALSMAANSFLGNNKGTLVAIGGGVYILVCLLKDFLPATFPGLTMMAYNRNVGMNAYKHNVMGSYNRTSTPIYTPIGMGAPPYGPDRTTASAPHGGQYIVALRNRRFN